MKKFKVQSETKSLWLKILSDVVVLIIFFCAVVSLGLSAIRYTLPVFFIDGQSMYPTFNKDYNGTWAISPERHDFGFFERIKNPKHDVKRYDIVVTFFKDDYDEKGILKPESDAKRKVKRVIGLPNEEVQFIDNELYIKKVGSKEFEKQTLPFDNSASYNWYYNEHGVRVMDMINAGPFKLNDGEYFVKGDNWHCINQPGGGSRYASKDSLYWSEVGAVKENYIDGKILFVAGSCLLKGESDCYDLRYTWPRFM